MYFLLSAEPNLLISDLLLSSDAKRGSEVTGYGKLVYINIISRLFHIST